jgi:hypothetical protein
MLCIRQQTYLRRCFATNILTMRNLSAAGTATCCVIWQLADKMRRHLCASLSAVADTVPARVPFVDIFQSKNA